MTTRKLPRRNTNRALSTWLTGKTELTPAERMDQMYIAHRLRNFVWGLNAPQLDGNGGVATVRFQGVASVQSPPFARDMVITDIVGSVGVFELDSVPSFGLQVSAIGVPGVAVDDFFGAGQFLPSYYVCDQTPQTGRYSPPDDDPSFKAMEFVPRILPKGQQLQARWAVDSTNGTSQGEFGGEVLAVQSVYALCAGEPYSCPLPKIQELCRRYVETQKREYYILDLQIPFASLPTIGTTRGGFVTAPHDRPLLIYAMSSNLTGCQISIRDESKQHDFAKMVGFAPNVIIETDGTLFPGVVTPYNPTLLPIWGIAPDPTDNFDIINDAWRYWPVPHFLEPGASLTIQLRAGLRDNVQTISTSGLLVTTNPAHIAFACLTL